MRVGLPDRLDVTAEVLDPRGISTTVTESVYRHELRPVLLGAAR